MMNCLRVVCFRVNAASLLLILKQLLFHKGGCECIGPKLHQISRIRMPAAVVFASDWREIFDRTTRKIVPKRQMYENSRRNRRYRIRVVTQSDKYSWSPFRIIWIVLIIMTYITVFLRIPEAVQRLNSNFRSMAPQCAWYEEGTELSFRASDTFRSTFPYPIANNNMSVMALEKVEIRFDFRMVHIYAIINSHWFDVHQCSFSRTALSNSHSVALCAWLANTQRSITTSPFLSTISISLERRITEVICIVPSFMLRVCHGRDRKIRILYALNVLHDFSPDSHALGNSWLWLHFNDTVIVIAINWSTENPTSPKMNIGNVRNGSRQRWKSLNIWNSATISWWRKITIRKYMSVGKNFFQWHNIKQQRIRADNCFF